MKKSLFIAAALIFVLAAYGCAGGGQSRQGEVDYNKAGITIATGDTTGTYYSFGGTLASILGEKTGVPFRIVSTAGSMDNAQRIANGKADLAIIQTDIADHAWFGAHLFDGKKNTDFAAIGALFTEECHLVVSTASGITTFEGLKGKAVSIGEAGSGTEVNARQMLEVYDVELEDIRVSQLGFRDSADALKSGRIDAFFCVSRSPVQVIAELLETTSIRFIEIDDEHAARLIRFNPYYSQYLIPAGTYKGQVNDRQTLSVKATLVASWNLPDDLVYLLTKTLFESKAEIEAANAAGTELDISFANDRNSITIPFHPGASRYYKEMTGSIIEQTLPLKRPED